MGKLPIRDYRQYLSIFLHENGSKSAELLLAYTIYFLQLPYQKKNGVLPYRDYCSYGSKF